MSEQGWFVSALGTSAQKTQIPEESGRVNQELEARIIGWLWTPQQISQPAKGRLLALKTWFWKS